MADRRLAPVEHALRAHLTVYSVIKSPVSYILKNKSIASLQYYFREANAFIYAFFVSTMGLIPFCIIFYLYSLIHFSVS